MANYVLVHGATAGGWIYRPVASVLRKAGHEAFTPTLTGLGERVHLAHPDVDLDTHINDILGVLQFENLQNVTLVGSSYAGMVITGVAERAPERLSRLIYMDAFVPQNGKSIFDLLGPEFVGAMLEATKEFGEGWRLPVIPSDKTADWPLTPQPIKTLQQPIEITNPDALNIPRTYIHCTGDKPELPEALVEILKNSADRARSQGWTIQELDADHSPEYSAPEDLAKLLIQIS